MNRQLIPPQYAPYESESESETESESKYSASSSSSYYNSDSDTESVPDIPNYKAFAEYLHRPEKESPNYPILQKQYALGENKAGGRLAYSEYKKEETKPIEYAKTSFKTSPKNNTALITLASRDRDRIVFNQPTLTTLRLPRLYRNVTSINLTDIKFLTSFYYFRTDKENLEITILEKGRTINNVITATPNIISSFIRQGSYNITNLLNEIQTQLNRTPLFYDYVNGISDFANSFASTGDFGLNFNEPGDNFYDNVKDDFIYNPNKNEIVAKFWQVRYANRSSYTFDEILVAYYYPPLKEFLVDDQFTTADKEAILQGGVKITTDVNSPDYMATTTDVQDRILYTFQGIDDAVILAVIRKNTDYLDNYRTQHTFRYSLVNKYNVTIEPYSQRVVINTTGLNTSLANLLTTQYNKTINQAINSNGYTPATYSTLVANNDKLGAVIRDMYVYQQNAFRDIFAVPYDSYSLQYYANLSNTILLKNGSNAIGIPANTSEAFSTLGSNYSLITDVLDQERVNPPKYWPHISSVGAYPNDTVYSVNLSSATQNFNYPYIMTGCNFNSNYKFIDASGIIFRDRLSGSGNCVVDIEPLQYSVFKFHSPVRQTLQIETLPRPLIYRLPDYNSNHRLYPPLVRSAFDNSYSYIDLSLSTNLPYDPSPFFSNDYEVIYDNLPKNKIREISWWGSNTTSPTLQQAKEHWLADYATSFSNITATLNSGYVSLDINTPNQSLYYHFRTPYYAGDSNQTDYKYRYQFNLDIELSNISTNSYTAFVYHDRAAFQADVNNDFRFQENDKFFKYSTNITTANIVPAENLIRATLQFPTYENEDYYVYIRPDSLNFGANSIRVIPYFDDAFSTTMAENSTIADILATGFDMDVLDDYGDIEANIHDAFPTLPSTSVIQRMEPIFGYDYPIYYELFSTLYDSTLTSPNPTIDAISQIIDIPIYTVSTLYRDSIAEYNLASSAPTPTLLSTALDTIISTTQALYSTSFTTLFPTDYAGEYVINPDTPTNTSNYYMRRLPTVLPSNLTKNATGIESLIDTHKYSALYHYEGYSNTYRGPEFYLSNFNYASIYDPAYIRLPIFPSTLWTPDPTTAEATRAVQTLDVPLGYDKNGVSDDYTDYMPFGAGQKLSFSPNTVNIGIDPISRYQFQSNAPYNSTLQAFIISTATVNYTSNAIYVPGLSNVYYSQDISGRNTKLVHYYSPNYIPEPNGNPAEIINNSTILVNNLIQTSTLQRPYTASTTRGYIQGYDYDLSGNIQLGSGAIGFCLIPPDGIWAVDKFTFRSALYQSNALYDPNSQIKYLAVYPSYDVVDCNFKDIHVSSAIQLLKFSKRQAFSPNISENPDFFDLNGGTYYQYINDPDFESDYAGRYLGGYTQPVDTIVNRTVDTYNLIALDASFNVVRIKALSGSAIPYPFYNEVSTSMTYLNDGKTYSYDPQLNPTYGMVYPLTKNLRDNSGNLYPSSIYVQQSNWLPDITQETAVKYGPSSGTNDGTQSQYILSKPIGTTTVPYALPFDIYKEQNAFYMWPSYEDSAATQFDLQYKPKSLNANTSNYLCVQETDFRIYYFPTVPGSNVDLSNRTLTPKNLRYVLSADEIFSPSPYPSSTPRIDLVAYTGNTTKFIFLGLEDTGSNMKAHFRFFHPNNGLITTFTPSTPLYLSYGDSVEFFTWNDYNDYAISAKYWVPASNNFLGRFYWSSDAANTYQIQTLPGLSTMVHAQDPQVRRLYVMPLVQDLTNGNDNGNTYYKTTTDQASWPGTLYNILPKDSNSPATYTSIVHNNNAAFDEVFCTTHTSNLASYVYRVRYEFASTISLTTSNFALIDRVATHFYGLDSNSENFDQDVSNSVIQFSGGYNNARWALCDQYPYVWGNRNIFEDLEFRIGAAWQIFYPYQNVQLKQVNANYHPITDQSYIEYPEYPHVQAFYYRNSNDYAVDTHFNWGQESSNHFKVANVNMAGYEFNSYIYNVPLVSSSSSNYQYLALRNYSPTEKSQVLMRFYLPNLYDFGYLTFNDLIGEIALHSTLQKEDLFNPVYADTIAKFDTKFNVNTSLDISGRLWGANLIPSFPGSNFQSSFVNYQSFASTYVNLYTTFASNAAVIEKVIQSGINGVNSFISTQLKYILPPNALKRQRFTDPLTFSILWKDSLSPQFAALDQEWGLGWNLGYSKENTPFNTVARGSSFYKIVDDYVYLRLNPEMNMNRMDTGATENLAVTREPTGQTKGFFGKLLLSGFNSYATTMISLPIDFNPPLGKLETLTFQWVNNAGVQLNNTDCDWSCTVQVVEQNNVATAESNFITGHT